MPDTAHFTRWLSVLRGRPDARAILAGSDAYPHLRGTARFYQTSRGVLTAVEASGLPEGGCRPGDGFFAFHIHGGGSCAGDRDDPFRDAGAHYDPRNRPHPAHAGDLPPLLSSGGYAFQVFLTDRFTVREILGKTILLHAGPDDFTSQPAGNAGERIACGEIRRFRCR